MNMLSRLLATAGLLLVFAACTPAQVTWTLEDVTFSNGNVATGTFTTNAATNAILSFSIVVSGPDTAAAFTATQMVDSYLPGEIGIANTGFTEYVDLFPSTNLTNAGGIIPLLGTSVDCPGCGTIVTTGGHDPEVVGVTPEPATYGLMLLGLGIMVGKYVVRRRQQSTETLLS